MKFWGHGVLSGHKPILSETQHWSVPRAIIVYYRFPNKRGNKDWCGGLMITMLCIKRAHTPNWARFLPAFDPVGGQVLRVIIPVLCSSRTTDPEWHKMLF